MHFPETIDFSMHLMNESKITSASSADCYVQLSCSWVNWSTGRIADTFWLQDWTVGRKVASSTWRTEPNFLRWDRTSASPSQRAASSFNSILGFLGIFCPGYKIEPKSFGCHSRSWAGAMPLQTLQFSEATKPQPKQVRKKLGSGLLHRQ